ncbi:MAG: hypothetical protein V7785_21065 [Bermanella sp.]
MRGYLNIANIYQLKAGTSQKLGLFQWQRRMGIHLAFHRDPMNIFLHTVFPVFNALGILMMCYPFFIELPVINETVSLALLVLMASFLLYALVDVLAAILVSAPVLLLYPLCQWSFELLGGSIFWLMIAGSLIFIIALWIQVGIGHKICENGLGDEIENIVEMFESKNPIQFIILPVYTVLDLLFMLGYRKSQGKLVWEIMNELRPKLVKNMAIEMKPQFSK